MAEKTYAIVCDCGWAAYVDTLKGDSLQDAVNKFVEKCPSLVDTIKHVYMTRQDRVIEL